MPRDLPIGNDRLLVLLRCAGLPAPRSLLPERRQGEPCRRLRLQAWASGSTGSFSCLGAAQGWKIDRRYEPELARHASDAAPRRARRRARLPRTASTSTRPCCCGSSWCATSPTARARCGCSSIRTSASRRPTSATPPRTIRARARSCTTRAIATSSRTSRLATRSASPRSRPGRRARARTAPGATRRTASSGSTRSRRARSTPSSRAAYASPPTARARCTTGCVCAKRLGRSLRDGALEVQREDRRARPGVVLQPHACLLPSAGCDKQAERLRRSLAVDRRSVQALAPGGAHADRRRRRHPRGERFGHHAVRPRHLFICMATRRRARRARARSRRPRRARAAVLRVLCRRASRADGYLLHKYNPDRSLASSWYPWCRPARARAAAIPALAQLPIQEDETALVLWAMWQHYMRNRDLDAMKGALRRASCARAADFMVGHREQDDRPARAVLRSSGKSVAAS